MFKGLGGFFYKKIYFSSTIKLLNLKKYYFGRKIGISVLLLAKLVKRKKKSEGL